MKAVQGETGHATAQMVTDRYAEKPRACSHIIITQNGNLLEDVSKSVRRKKSY